MRGQQVCAIHGGKTPKGIASPGFRHGRYSKYLPEALVERYEAARNDPELLGLRDEVALVDARLGVLLQRSSADANAATWRQLGESWGALRTAFAEKQAEKLAGLVPEVDALVTGALREEEGWAEIGDLLERRRRLVETEQRRLERAHQTVTVEQVMGIIQALGMSVREHVHDRAALSAIQTDLLRLVGRPPG